MRRLLRRLRFENWPGECPICEQRTRFFAFGPWYRDQLLCERCRSIPRERALMRVIQLLYPDWRSLKVHESSPAERGVSAKLKRECPGYVPTQYPELDLERQHFGNEVFDLVITQDVFEHLLEPDLAIREIVRTLKPGGAHIMTVPIVRKGQHSERRAARDRTHLKEPEYHANPVGEGSLVTVDWGYDIADYLTEKSGSPTNIFMIDDRRRGICAEYNDVVVTRKNAPPAI